MGRLLNPAALPAAKTVNFQPVRASARAPVVAPAPAATPRATMFHRIGLYSLSLYLCSGYANDLSLRVLGGKAYLSWLAGILVIFAFVGCGTRFRGMRSTTGKIWLGLMFAMLLSVPFSIWKAESVRLLETFIPRILFLFFYTCAFALNLKDVRTLFTANIVCTSAILLSSALFGSAVDGDRFAIPGSLFFGGGNDLALALVCSLGFTLYLILRKSLFAQILGAAEFLVTVLFLLKTGSRGSFVALASFVVVWLVFSGSRWKLIAVVIPALAIPFALPEATLHRLVNVAIPGSVSETEGPSDSALQSQLERTMLLKRSITFAMSNPVLGLGPGTFTDALYKEDVINRTHTHALGTHNTYTQIASECGIPALMLYLGVLFGSIRSNYRIMKRTRKAAGAESVFNMSLCLLGSLVAYAIASGFHHVGYTQTLPILSGLSVALSLASRSGDVAWIKSETAAGKA